MHMQKVVRKYKYHHNCVDFPPSRVISPSVMWLNYFASYKFEKTCKTLFSEVLLLCTWNT